MGKPIVFNYAEHEKLKAAYDEQVERNKELMEEIRRLRSRVSDLSIRCRIAESADAVEVVRCKDCKWYMQKQKNLPYNVTKRYCNRTCTLATKEDDYCSYGERREP